MPVLVLALPVAVVGLVVALLRRVVVTVGVNEHRGVVEVARHTRRWRVVGLLLGGVVAVLLLALGQRVDALGRATALAPTVLGAGVLLGTIAGELTRPARRRHPSLRRRRDAHAAGDPAARTGGRARRVDGSCSPGRSAIGAAWGSADDLGRAGRVLSEQLHCASTPTSGPVADGEQRGPWPGSFYAVPLAVALLVLAGLVAVALRADRQPPASRPRQPGARHDAALLVGGQRPHRRHGHGPGHPRARSRCSCCRR